MGTTIRFDDATTGPELRFNVAFGESGTYYVWVRGMAPNGADNSIHVGVDGQVVASAADITGFTVDTWSWEGRTAFGRAAIEVPNAGLHTVNVWMREDGVALDRLLLTTDAGYVPRASGPAASQRVNERDATATPRSELSDNGSPRLTLAASDGTGNGGRVEPPSQPDPGPGLSTAVPGDGTGGG